ncbi:serine hydrolase domain-containing protein [Nocardioides alcanivorans]|uniref:serine hydrolase domain-containing protein n=1 Tax=Nocardioides alcanivorans TaxID=2897352 RepID=UPI0024B21E14|nr:serine hydrolase [Nocardioides alcanivorans]
MTRTTLGLSGRAAQGYYLSPFSDVPVVEPTFEFRAMAACGGLASTARDLAAWSGFVADPIGEVLSPDSFEEMLQPQVMVDLDRWSMAFGLGFMLARRGEHVFVGHTGGMPGHISGVFTHRASGTGGLALMNTTSAPDPAALAIDLASGVIEREPQQEAWVPGSDVPADLVGILGRWYSEGEPFDFSVRQGRLQARHPALPEHKAPAVFERLDDSTYRTVSGREEGELLRVRRRPDGSVDRMSWATYVVTREPLAFGAWLDDPDEPAGR